MMMMVQVKTTGEVMGKETQTDTRGHSKDRGKDRQLPQQSFRTINYINSGKRINPVDGPMLGKKSCW
jgi:hypothetical protein